MRTSGSARWAPLSGALFVALWVAAYLVLGGTVEDSTPDAEILAYFGDKGQRDREFITLVLLVVASLPFVVFLSVLRERLAHAEGGAGIWTMAAFAAGLVSTALWAVAAALFVVPSMTTGANDEFEFDMDTFNSFAGAGYLVWSGAGMMMSVLVLATSILGIRAGVIPGWLSWVGFAVALGLLAAFLVIPVIFMLVWLLAVSIALWRPDIADAPAGTA